ALQWFGNNRSHTRVVSARNDIQFGRLDKFLPVSLDGHGKVLSSERSAETTIRISNVVPGSGAPGEIHQNQTRRRLRGRQPLWGMDVTSRMLVTLKPAAWSARSAD